MKTYKVVTVGLSIIALQLGTMSVTSGSTLPTAKKYANCKALNKVYPGGVAKSAKVKNKGGKTKYTPKVSSSLYKANKTKDRDGDGIACER
jgi:hypothetical protein